MEMRFEAWTRPETGTFERLFPLPQITQWSMKLGIFGQGLLVLPSAYSRLDDLLFVDAVDHANDKASLIRAFIGDTHLYDFYASRMSIDANETETRLATVTGGGPGSAFSRTRVRHYDYPESPSIEPDWQYGYGPSLIINGDFDEAEDGVLNPGAEDGSTLGWFTTGDPITLKGLPDNFEAIEGNVTAHSGDWYFQFTGDTYQGVRQDFKTTGYYSGTAPNEVWNGYRYETRVWVLALAGQQYRVSVDGAASVPTGTMFNNSGYVDGVGDNTWQMHQVDIIADESGTGRLHITSRATGQTINFDDVKVDGWGMGCDPWEARGTLSLFEGSPLFAHSGTHSLKWKPASGVAGNDVVYQSAQVVAGQNVAASVWVYHTEGSAKLMRLTLAIPGVDPNVSNVASTQVSVPSGTWTEIVAAGVSALPTVLFEVRYDETGAPASDLFIDDAILYQGRPKATAGLILTELLDDGVVGTTRDALSFLTPTFSATLDSNGDPWNYEIAMTVKRGQPYRRVFDVLANEFGYEFRIRPNPADHTTLWFDAYNPDSMGTDFSLTDGGTIFASGLVSVGPVIRSEPAAVYAMVEGDNQEWGEALDATMQAVWGDIETYTGTTELLVGTLDAVAAQTVAASGATLVVCRFQSPTLVPGRDYVLGDYVRLTLGDNLVPSDVYRCVGITVESGNPEPTFQVQFIPRSGT